MARRKTQQLVLHASKSDSIVEYAIGNHHDIDAIVCRSGTTVKVILHPLDGHHAYAVTYDDVDDTQDDEHLLIDAIAKWQEWR